MESYNDFKQALSALITSASPNEVSQHNYIRELRSNWTWQDHETARDHGYATKKCLRSIASPNLNDDAPQGVEDSQLEPPDDDAALKPTASRSIISIQWDIVFSRTYQVPMLCFQAWNADGSIVALDEIMCAATFHMPVAGQDIKPTSSYVPLEGSAFPLIQQAEHPTTNQIVWSLHPCNVREAVEAILPLADRSPERWLETWLMLSSTLVDLR